MNLVNICINLFSFSFPSYIFNSINLLLHDFIDFISFFPCIVLIISLISFKKFVFSVLIFSINISIPVAVSKMNSRFENNIILSYISSKFPFTLNISLKIFNSFFISFSSSLKGSMQAFKIDSSISLIPSGLKIIFNVLNDFSVSSKILSSPLINKFF